jgi:outer membrane immunogenic protein
LCGVAKLQQNGEFCGAGVRPRRGALFLAAAHATLAFGEAIIQLIVAYPIQRLFAISVGRFVVKKSICTVALLALGICGAAAEEMARPPSQFLTSPNVPFLAWSGLYAGINGGYGWSSPNIQYIANDPASQAGTCAAIGGAKCIPTPSINRDGGLFGAQIGYNWQFSQLWLVGVEADYQWSDIAGQGVSSFHLGGVGGAAVPSTMTAKETIGSFGTIRVRLGALPLNSLLTYGTAGVAIGQVKGSLALSPGVTGAGISAGGFSYSCTAGVSCFSGSSSTTSVGWTAGGGAEYALTSNITLKGEALWVRLDKLKTTATATALAAGGPTTPSSFTGTFDFAAFFVFRGGVNYRF